LWTFDFGVQESEADRLPIGTDFLHLVLNPCIDPTFQQIDRPTRFNPDFSTDFIEVQRFPPIQSFNIAGHMSEISTCIPRRADEEFIFVDLRNFDNTVTLRVKVYNLYHDGRFPYRLGDSIGIVNAHHDDDGYLTTKYASISLSSTFPFNLSSSTKLCDPQDWHRHPTRHS
jgi:hypothetical protein